MDTRTAHSAAELAGLGMLEATGDDARTFLHAQLTNDVVGMPPGRARYAGWCSAKGRLLASFLVVPHGGGFLLQLARDLAPSVAKRLAMFVLRAKVKVSEASDAWAQFGLWGAGSEERLAALGLAASQSELGVSEAQDALAVRIGAGRYLVAVPAARRASVLALLDGSTEQAWAVEEIRAGRALVTLATQDQFVPQMLDYQLLGAIDFKKGCYPGQEIVARTQYRGQLKRRLVRARVAAPARPGQDVHAADLPGQAAGTVVNAAEGSEGASELLAVVPVASLEQHAELRLGSPEGPRLEILALPAAS
ncbi:MAG: folate-binding protein [Betaproteobacteria bacterium]|nr:folate-binding protein [Betaproteobacteria bacterium]